MDVSCVSSANRSQTSARDLRLHEDRLTDAGAVAHDDEGDLAGGAEMGDPAADGDGLAGVGGQLGDADVWSGHMTLMAIEWRGRGQ